MDYIDNSLTNNARDDRVDPAIQKAIGLAKRTLNRYYKATDMSSTYRIAMREFFLSFWFSLPPH